MIRSPNIQKYLRPRLYLNWVRTVWNKSRPKKPIVLPSSERPVFWTGSGGCGFLRTYDLLQTNHQSSVFYKSTAKLQNQKIDPEVDMIWDRSTDESARIQHYFGQHGVYHHHIAPYTVRYAREIIEHFKGKAVFLCLKSAKSVDSMWIQWGYRNPLTTDRTRKNRSPIGLFPDFSHMKDSREATQKYYDAFYGMADDLERADPEHFCIVDADRFFTDKDYFTSINDRFNLKLEFKKYRVACDDQTITTSLHGGLGNNMFQMAEPVAFCAEHGLPEPVFATWDMPDFPPSYRADLFIGGHTGPSAGTAVDLQKTFARVKWTSDSRAKFDHKFMLNDMYAFADVHHQRDAIVRYFEPSEEVKKYILDKYPTIAGPRTLSLHHRAGWLPVDTHTFKAFGEEWYKDVFTTHFPDDYDVFVFTDKLPAGTELMNKVATVTSNRYTLVDENVFISLIMMSMCKNHLLSNSTLSFWGAYLDPHQPAGTTILHSSFTTYHSEPHVECRMIPYQEWKII